jgi:hypothetical protein
MVMDNIASHNPYSPADYIIIRAQYIINVVVSGSSNGSARPLPPKKRKTVKRSPPSSAITCTAAYSLRRIIA